jgi:hypothetical protein
LFDFGGLRESLSKYLTFCKVFFDGFILKIKFKFIARAQEDSDDDDFEDADEIDEDGSEEDEEEEEKKGSPKKMNGIENTKGENGKADDDDDSDLDDLTDDEYDEYDKTLLENYTSCIDENDEVDEFVIFKDTLQGKLFVQFRTI